jgi:multimeric flavodoxin WrbA
MEENSKNFNGLSAVFINCSIKKDKTNSHTQRLINRVIGIMKAEGVEVDDIYALDHTIAFGMVKDGREEGWERDDWPELQRRILAADILVIGTPIWLGAKSSVATQVIERLYAYSSDTNEKGQYIYYGRVGGCIVTGNEDGVKHCGRDILYSLQHIGYTIPPQADCGWIGEVGPGPSYGDTEFGDKKLDVPMGYDSEFTNKNATIMAWNLMHMAKLLKDNGGISQLGTTSSEWRKVSNAQDQNPDAE